MNKKLFNNKIAKGLVSLLTIIILLSSILAGSILYENNITANVIKETSINDKPLTISIKEINDIKGLSQLNEGWYQIRHGYVFYLDTFNSYVPLYIKVLNPEQQNGLLVVDEEGNIEFDKHFEGLSGKEVAEIKNQEPAQNQITGEVTGLEKVSGFAVLYRYGEEVLVGNQKSTQTVEKSYPPTQKIPYQEIITGVPGQRDTLKKHDVDGVVTETYFKDPTTGAWTLSSQSPTSTAPKPPTILPTDTLEDAQKKKDDFYQVASAYYKNQQTDKDWQEVQKLFTSYLKAQPGTKAEADAKAKFESTYTKFQFAQKDPYDIVLTYTAGSDDEKKLAKQIFIEGYNNPNLMQALAYDYYNYESNALLTQIILERGKNTEAYKALSSEQQAEINRHLQNNEIGKKTPGVIYVPDSLVFVNKEGFIVDISQNVATGGYTATPTKERYEGTLPGVTPAKSRFNEEQQASIKAQGLTPTSDGKIVDTLNNEYSTVLAYNPQTENLEERWIVDKNTAKPPAKINVEGKEIPINPDKFKTESGLAVYKDTSGKLYDQQGNGVTGGRVVIDAAFGNIKTQLTYNLVQGQIDKDNPVGAKIGTKPVAVQAFAELQGFLKAAGNNPQTEGDFNKPNEPLVIKTEKGDIVALAYGFEIVNGKFKGTEIQTDLGIAKGTTIQSNYQKGVPLLIKTTSEDGKTSISEKKDFIEIDTGRKDAKGQPIKYKTLVTTEWTKRQENFEFNGNLITLRTEKVYERSKEGIQNNEKYTELNSNALTGEPISINIRESGDIYTVSFFRGSEAVGFFEKGVPLSKNGGIITEEELKQLQSSNPSLYNKIIENLKIHDQFISRQFFANVERVFTEFQGLGYYATFFFKEDELLRWRDEVDKAFATLYLGTEYWSSAICGNYLDGADRGIAYAETPQGLAQVGAHIEATRTEPLITPTGREFIYKITFNVRNGDYAKDPRAPEEMGINVVLKGQRTAKVFRQNKIIKRGASFGRVGISAIVKSSTAFYGQVCLTFDNIPLRWKLDNKELCNTIVVSSGAPAPLATTPQPSTATTPSQGAEESEFEDF